MNILPEGFELGVLEIIETYMYHDVPRLFVCSSTFGDLYMAVWVDEEGEGEDFREVWLYAKVSIVRFERARSGEMELRTVFSEAEGGSVFVYRASLDVSRDRLERMESSQIPDAWLSRPGARLNFDPDTVPQGITRTQVTEFGAQIDAGTGWTDLNVGAPNVDDPDIYFIDLPKPASTVLPKSDTTATHNHFTERFQLA